MVGVTAETGAVIAVFERRVAPACDLAEHAGDVADTAFDMAVRFHHGGKLLAWNSAGATCSDAAVPGTVVALLDDGLAIVGTAEGEEEVSVALVDAGIGDTVLVHAGEAIAVMPK